MAVCCDRDSVVGGPDQPAAASYQLEAAVELCRSKCVVCCPAREEDQLAATHPVVSDINKCVTTISFPHNVLVTVQGVAGTLAAARIRGSMYSYLCRVWPARRQQLVSVGRCTRTCAGCGRHAGSSSYGSMYSYAPAADSTWSSLKAKISEKVPCNWNN